MKDFDITQINKDTKVVVFRIPYSDITIDDLDNLNIHINRISSDLKEQGIVAVFTDKLISVEPLTDELLSIGNLKTID